MIWANPWAWLGLAAIAVPIAVHLLARQVTVSVPFPTLRFLRAAAVVDVRRRRLTDVLLLALRIAIIAAAVAALAQPFWPSAASPAIYRVVIVDTSASVDRAAAAQALGASSADADETVTIERHDLAGALDEAGQWLSRRDGRRGVRVISDFQTGALPAEVLAALPDDAGVELIQVPSRLDEADTLAGVAAWSIEGDTTHATWHDDASGAVSIDVVSAPGEALAVEAALAAAAATTHSHVSETRRVLFVLPGAPERDALLTATRPIDAPWMYDAHHAIRARGIDITSGIVTRDGVDVTAFFLSTADPLTIGLAAHAVMPALATFPAAELDPRMMDDVTLRALEREPSAPSTVERPTDWAGRWFWIAALLLVGIETLVRRDNRRREQPEDIAHAA